MSQKPSSLSRILLIAAFSVIAMLPSLYNGMPAGPDQTQHYQSMSAAYNSLISGEIYPGITDGIDHHFGDYRLRFYPPFTYYVLAAARMVIRDWFAASLFIFTAAFFAGGLGIYLWALEEFEPSQALIAAAIFIFAPYHLNQLYNSFLLAEFLAMAILPFCFLFLTRVCRRGRWADALGLAISFALLILTHLPMTIIGSVAMAIYSLFLIRKGSILSTVTKLCSAVLSGVTLTAFYWSRWLPELAWIRHSLPQYFSGEYDFRSNFLMVPDHLIDFQTDERSLWLLELMLFTTLLITVPTIVALWRERSRISKYVLALSVVFGFAVFMLEPFSGFLWNNVAFMQRVQFPWRWLGPGSAFAAVFASIGINRASNALSNSKRVLLPIGLGAIMVIFVFTGVFITRGAVFVSRDDSNRQIAAITETEGCECWRPVWALPSAFDQKEDVVADARKIEVKTWSATRKSFHVDAGESATATIAAFYYPRWQATVNGIAWPVEKTGSGILSLSIPSEAANIDLIFREPAYIQAANIASALAWIFVIVLLAILLSKRTGRT